MNCDVSYCFNIMSLLSPTKCRVLIFADVNGFTCLRTCYHYTVKTDESDWITQWEITYPCHSVLTLLQEEITCVCFSL